MLTNLMINHIQPNEMSRLIQNYAVDFRRFHQEAYYLTKAREILVNFKVKSTLIAELIIEVLSQND